MPGPNSYAPGNCTFYVKQLVSWVQNGWGDAKDWYTNAQKAGYKASQAPVKGALAVWGPGVDPPQGFGHVALVQDVRQDGSFVVTEMNWQGLGKVDTRTVTDRSNLLGFILPPGSAAPTPGLPDIPGAIQQAGARIGQVAQVGAGGLLILGGLVLAAVLFARRAVA